MVALIGVSGFLLAVFLSYRIWVASLRRWRAVPLLILALSFAGGAVALDLAVWSAKQSSNLSLTTRYQSVWAWFALDTASEAVATASLVWLLVLRPRRARSGTSAARAGAGTGPPAQSLLSRAVYRAVETNAIALMLNALTVALFGTAHMTLYAYTVPAFCLTNVYAINLFAQLLSRPALQLPPANSLDTNFAAVTAIHFLSEVKVEVSEPTAAMRVAGAQVFARRFDGPSLCHDDGDSAEEEVNLGLGGDSEKGTGTTACGHEGW